MLEFSELIDQTIQIASRVNCRPNAARRAGRDQQLQRMLPETKSSAAADENPADRLARFLSDSVRGDGPLIFFDRPRELPAVFDAVSSSALGVMMKAGVDSAWPENVDGDLVVDVSTYTHELQQLRYSRPGVPLCQQGHDCVARQIPGAAMLGPLPIYLSPSEQVDLDVKGKLNLDDLSESKPRQCLLCIRRMVDCIRMACEHASHSDGVGKNFIRAPFTNPVGIDGYSDSAIGVRPHHHCIAGAASIVRSDIPVWIEYDKLSKPEGFIVVQDPACVFNGAKDAPFL